MHQTEAQNLSIQKLNKLLRNQLNHNELDIIKLSTSWSKYPYIIFSRKKILKASEEEPIFSLTYVICLLTIY